MEVFLSNLIKENRFMLSEDLNLSENEEIKPVQEAATILEGLPQEQIVTETTEVVEEIAVVNEEASTEVVAEVLVPEIETTTEVTAEIEVSNPEEIVAEIVEAAQPTEVALETASYETIQEVEIEDETVLDEATFQSYSKKEFVELVEKLNASVKSETATATDMKNADIVLKEIRPLFETIKRTEKAEAKKAFIAESGSDEGFVFENDNYNVRFDAANTQIRETKNAFFNKLEQNREDNFVVKTKLLTELRELVANEEVSPSKNSWTNFKKIQEAWKASGSVSAAHNQSLWAAYNALVDRYFSNRNIFNELMDLDRKKNQQAKEALCTKVEGLVGKLEEGVLTNSLIKEANDVFEEYKHIGPAPKDSNDKLWARFKTALDKLYEKRREQDSESDSVRGEVLKVKEEMVKVADGFAEFKADTIQNWNAKTKELQELQDQWNAIKGGMPRDRGRDISKQFWASLKTFFTNKSEFFKNLENERGTNLSKKNALIEEVNGFITNEDFSATNTNRVIELQKEWKTIGFVPEKFKDSIYEKFKAACDGFFENKRNTSSSVDKEYEENLAKKLVIIEGLEAAATNSPDLNKLPELKAEFSAIGYVPKKNMADIQKRFIDAVNLFVKNSTSVSASEKEKMMMRTDRPSNDRDRNDRGPRTGGGNQAFTGRVENNDVRKKIQKIEDEIALYRNNIEFFARSKNAASLRAEIDLKIAKAEKELSVLKAQL
jgi:hypothetical protein